MLKYFTFCNPARQELIGHLRLLVWGARILEAQSCALYINNTKKYTFHKIIHTILFELIGCYFINHPKFEGHIDQTYETGKSNQSVTTWAVLYVIRHLTE